MTPQNLDVGGSVYYLSESEGWASGSVVRLDGTKIVVTPDGGGGAELSLSKSEVQIKGRLAKDGVKDMMALDILHEGAIQENIHARYQRDEIYTMVGPILISVNPYKRLPLYGDDVMRRYAAAGAEAITTLDPHVYGTAAAAYAQMSARGTNQSILISGESGAGKTEATKVTLGIKTPLPRLRRRAFRLPLCFFWRYLHRSPSR